MPLWRIFSHPNTFNPSQRDAVAKAITDLYVDNIKLPPFYVNVLFIDVDENHTYVGGEKKSNFVRIVAEQIARVMPADTNDEGLAYRRRWLDKIHAALRPHILDRKELELEFHIAETPRSLWRVQGIDPPPPNSEAEQMWRDQNKAIPWDHAPAQHA